MAPQQTVKLLVNFFTSLRKNSVTNYASMWTLFSPPVRRLDVLYKSLPPSVHRTSAEPVRRSETGSRCCPSSCRTSAADHSACQCIPQSSNARRTNTRRSASALIAAPMTSRPSTFNIGQLNARSIGNKSAVVSHCIAEHHLDVFAIVESWHDSSDSPNLIAATPPGYRYVEKARRRKK